MLTFSILALLVIVTGWLDARLERSGAGRSHSQED